MRTIRLLILPLASILLVSSQIEAEDDEPRKAFERFEAAYSKWNAQGFEEAADIFREARDKDPEDWQALYWEGVARFHIVLKLQADKATRLDDNSFDALLESARKPLKKVVKHDKTLATAHAMLATLAGMEINRYPRRALWQGHEFSHHLKSAMRYGDHDAQAQYLIGVNLLRRPKNQDGTAKALEHLNRAKDLFEDPTETSSDRRWGYDSCLAFIGVAFFESGQRDDAEEYFRRALSANSNNGLAIRRLRALKENTSEERAE